LKCQKGNKRKKNLRKETSEVKGKKESKEKSEVVASEKQKKKSKERRKGQVL